MDSDADPSELEAIFADERCVYMHERSPRSVSMTALDNTMVTFSTCQHVYIEEHTNGSFLV